MSNPITRPNDPANPAPEGAAGFKGLTKREHFAAVALQGLLACESEGWHFADDNARAINAVVHADALINALNNTNQ